MRELPFDEGAPLAAQKESRRTMLRGVVGGGAALIAARGGVAGGQQSSGTISGQGTPCPAADVDQGDCVTSNVALEEHVIFPDFLGYLDYSLPAVSPENRQTLIARLSDFGDGRLAAMDEAAIGKAVLSLSGPGVQIEPDTAVAVKLARQANDALATEIQKQPERYAGFAHLAMQDPLAAADELERSVRELSFVGSMVNGHTLGVYLDDARYDPFWERMQALDVPLYLHPDNSYILPYVFEGCPELLKPTWEWTVETSSHFLRLVFAGVFDRFPDLKIVLGHMGEALPFGLWRLDSRFKILAHPRPLAHPPSVYLQRNLFVTTSGMCDNVPLLAALSALGEDRVLFSVDYPYEDSAIAGRFIAQAAVTNEVRAKVASRNAIDLLKLES